MDNSTPYWIDCDIPKERDIALLRPATLSKGKRFETEHDVYETANTIVCNLQGRLWSIARKVEECVDGVQNCLLPICPICARHYRRYFFSEVLQIYSEELTGAQSATVYLETYEAGTLSNASIKTAHEKFQKQLRRSGFGGAILIGGTEVTYQPETKDWLLHLHLLSLAASQQAWKTLERPLSKYAVRDPLRVKSINDHIEQLSYLQKFHTYYRAGTPNGNSRTPPYPLKKAQLCELASWACNHEFTDFTFCFGVRRRYGRFCKT
jgi:hypothetical protein